MTSQFFNKKIQIVLIAAVVITLALALFSTVEGNPSSNVVQTILSPVRSLAATGTRTIEKFYNYAFKYEALEAENVLLRDKIASMESQIREVDTLKRENERYSALLSLSTEHDDYNFVPAYLISWDSGNYKSAFTLNKGKRDGITVGMIAITEHSEVVGIITEVGENWAKVSTILDSTLKVSACVSSTGFTGVVEGSYLTAETGNLRLNYLATDSVLRNGDQIVTTGSSLYPKDLVIGSIVDAGLDETGVSKYALLESSVDFNALEQVFLITGYQASAPAAEADAAAVQ